MVSLYFSLTLFKCTVLCVPALRKLAECCFPVNYGETVGED